MGDPRISVCVGVSTLECGEPKGGPVPGRGALGMDAPTEECRGK